MKETRTGAVSGPKKELFFMSEPRKLAVVFPGRGYTCSTGLLADGINLWKELGYEVLPLDFSAIPFSRIGTFAEAFDRVEAAALEQLAGADLVQCTDLVFFSKSMGTVAAARCAARLGLRPRMLPLTPLPETLDLTKPGDRVMGMAVGTADRYIDWHRVRAFCKERDIPCVIGQGVGHSLADKNAPANTEAIRQQVLALCRPL